MNAALDGHGAMTLPGASRGAAEETSNSHDADSDHAASDDHHLRSPAEAGRRTEFAELVPLGLPRWRRRPPTRTRNTELVQGLPV